MSEDDVAGCRWESYNKAAAWVDAEVASVSQTAAVRYFWGVQSSPELLQPARPDRIGKAGFCKGRDRGDLGGRHSADNSAARGQEQLARWKQQRQAGAGLFAVMSGVIRAGYGVVIRANNSPRCASYLL